MEDIMELMTREALEWIVRYTLLDENFVVRDMNFVTALTFKLNFMLSCFYYGMSFYFFYFMLSILKFIFSNIITLKIYLYNICPITSYTIYNYNICNLFCIAHYFVNYIIQTI